MLYLKNKSISAPAFSVFGMWNLIKANNKLNSMYAIVEIAGQQFKVAKDQKVYVHRLKESEGSKVT